MELLVRDYIVSSNSLFIKYQHSFMKGRSCSTNLLAILDVWSEAMENRIPVDTIYLDFTKCSEYRLEVRTTVKFQDGETFGNLPVTLTSRARSLDAISSISCQVALVACKHHRSHISSLIFSNFIRTLFVSKSC